MDNHWEYSQGQLGDYHWTWQLPNNWIARVTDNTQMLNPGQETQYSISVTAVAQPWEHWHRQIPSVQGKEYYKELSTAKMAALNLALSQMDLSKVAA